MLRLFTRTTCTGLLASLACLSAQASGIYSLTAIYDAASATVTDLNDGGEVAGTYYSDFATGPHAFVWKDGQFTDVSATIDPSTPYTEADGINNRGHLAGTYLEGTGTFRGYLLRNGQRTDIHVLPDESAVFAWEVNNADQVIGEAYDADDNELPYLWDNGHVTLLNPLPGQIRAVAHSLNDAGIAVGESGDSIAVVWRNENPVNLGVLPGTYKSIAYDINNRNHVVGTSFTANESTAFLWRGGSMKALQGVGGSGYSSRAASINDWDVVVGTTGNFQIATVWKGGRARDLNQLVRSDDPLKPYVNLISAVQINNAGDIVALGRDSRQPNFVFNYFLAPAH